MHRSKLYLGLDVHKDPTTRRTHPGVTRLSQRGRPGAYPGAVSQVIHGQ
ncbi:MAG: hypothetical protein MUE94_13620 [Verrucomicrobia bacterium]|nr:hypothetical protein [Verrucomicrobiota bacterium]